MKVMNEDGTVSGSFINMLITMIYLVLIVLAVFVPTIADSIVRLKDVMMWFFTASFGIWSVTTTIAKLNSKPTEGEAK